MTLKVVWALGIVSVARWRSRSWLPIPGRHQVEHDLEAWQNQVYPSALVSPFHLGLTI